MMTNDDRVKLLRNRIIDLYEKKGLEVAEKACYKLLEDSGKGVLKIKEDERMDALAAFRGEIAEVVLEIAVRDYVKNNKGSFYIKNLFVEKKDNPGHFNELDLTLFTEQAIVMFESKSYNVDKEIIGKGILRMEGRADFNVYEQSMAHLETLNDNLAGLKKKKGRGFVLIFFDYKMDKYKTVDNRKPEDKKVKFTENIIQVRKTLEKIRDSEDKVWHLDGVLSRLRNNVTNENKYREKHLKNISKYGKEKERSV